MKFFSHSRPIKRNFLRELRRRDENFLEELEDRIVELGAHIEAFEGSRADQRSRAAV